MSASAFVIFHCSSAELQARAGFDGWVMLLRDEFDTEDQAWPQERLRLASMAKRKMRRLEAAGVELDMLQLVTSCHLLLDPPREDREEERIWCIEFFQGRMYDFVVRVLQCPEHREKLPVRWDMCRSPRRVIAYCAHSWLCSLSTSPSLLCCPCAHHNRAAPRLLLPLPLP